MAFFNSKQKEQMLKEQVNSLLKEREEFRQYLNKCVKQLHTEIANSYDFFAKKACTIMEKVVCTGEISRSFVVKISRTFPSTVWRRTS